jgi:hypothetical protein
MGRGECRSTRRATDRRRAAQRRADACGFELDVRRSQPERSSIDPTLVHSMMRVPVDERLGRFDRAYVEVQKIAGSVRREHGELG